MIQMKLRKAAQRWDLLDVKAQADSEDGKLETNQWTFLNILFSIQNLCFLWVFVRFYSSPFI